MRKAMFPVQVLAILFIVATFSPAMAQDAEKYPARPVTMTLSFAPGGSADIICRAIAAVAPKYFSQPIIVVSKTGGGGLVALQNLASARPDGYTVHFGRTGDMTVAPNVEKMPFRMEEDFPPIANLVINHIVFSVPAKSPYKTIEDLIEDAKKNPGKISFGTAGALSIVRLTMERFCYEAGIKLNAIPFKGTGESMVAVMGGHVPVLTSTEAEILPHVQRGELRVLMTCTAERMRVFSQVPCAREKGFKTDNVTIGAVFARKGTPRVVMDRMEQMLKKVSQDKDFVDTIENKLGSEIKFISGADFAKYWSEDLKVIGDLVQRVGLTK